jgi:hypothetical protein
MEMAMPVSWCSMPEFRCDMPGYVASRCNGGRDERHERSELEELHRVDRAQRTPTTSDSLARSTSRAVAERWLTTS